MTPVADGRVAVGMKGQGAGIGVTVRLRVDILDQDRPSFRAITLPELPARGQGLLRVR